MSAQPVESIVYAPWQPDPVRQQAADYTLEDVLDLPPDAPRVELVSGVMQVVPSPTEDHQDICGLLFGWLWAHAPAHLKVSQGLGVAVALNHTYEPDVLIRRAGGTGGHHYREPDEMVLVVEVVSPGTRKRDRILEPAEYAAVGIPFYWRIEQNPVHVYAYRLVDGAYELMADSADVLEVDEPFPMRLPLNEITP